VTDQAHSDSLEGKSNISSEIVENGKPNSLSSVLKMVLFVLPPTLVSQLHPHGHNVMYGLSFIAGGLLQTLIPPHKYRIWAILGTSVTAAVTSPLILHWLGS
jgi:hypothetical protein